MFTTTTNTTSILPTTVWTSSVGKHHFRLCSMGKTKRRLSDTREASVHPMYVFFSCLLSLFLFVLVHVSFLFLVSRPVNELRRDLHPLAISYFPHVSVLDCFSLVDTFFPCYSSVAIPCLHLEWFITKNVLRFILVLCLLLAFYCLHSFPQQFLAL